MKRWMVLLPLAVGALPEGALANDRDLRATSIPAASCVAVGRGTDFAPVGGDFAAGAYILTGKF